MAKKHSFVYAGNRDISVNLLNFLHAKGYSVAGLMVLNEEDSPTAQELIKKVPYLGEEFIFRGNEIQDFSCVEKLNSLNPDFIFNIHFPLLFPQKLLQIPRKGVINLHPAFLPYNRGWHTPTWAIYEGTPYGATLHFMDNELDHGEILNQKQLLVDPEDTADLLYQKVLKLEENLFKETLQEILTGKYQKKIQFTFGTIHRKRDIEKIRRIAPTLENKILITQLRALTTNDITEAAYFEEEGERYLVQIKITKEKQERDYGRE